MPDTAPTIVPAGSVVRPLYLPLPFQDSAQNGRLILRDGSAADLRTSTRADAALLAGLFERLSPESRQRRFFSASPPAETFVADLCDSADPARQLTLLVVRTVGGAARCVASGSYTVVRPGAAEVAFAVDDDFQGKGIGTLLLERLALLAVRAGIRTLTAVTHADNRKMIEVFRESGLPVRERRDAGYVDIDIAGRVEAATVERMEMRDRIASAAGVMPFFRPNAVAVVGASRNPGSIGRRVLEALLAARFEGPVYPVNPNAGVVGCIRAFPTVKAVPERVDLAVICVPAAAVEGVVDDCAAAGVRALVVISAGFAEVGPEGRALQARVLSRVRAHGMRMVGPNCMGLLNADPAVRLNAGFSPVFPPAGSIAMSSQSGALGLALIAAARNAGMGFSQFVSVGNKADISGNDLLQYWEDDPATSVCLLYLESFGNPRRFARIARRVGRRKPVIVVKSGRSEAGRRAAGSHTAALAAGDTSVAALFRQTGVIRADTLDEMFDLAAVLGYQPLPAGRRVGIVTNAGGPAILCTDACEAAGLTVPAFSAALKARLAAFLPPAAGLSNPVDMVASATPEIYRATLREVLASDEVDAVVPVYIPVGGAPVEEIERVVREVVAESRTGGGKGKPVACVLMSDQPGRRLLEVAPGTGGEKIPAFPYPETPGRVLGKVATYAEWRSRPAELLLDFADMDLEGAKALCRGAAEGGGGQAWLGAEEVLRLLKCAGIPAAGRFAKSVDEAVAAAKDAGFPAAVKLASRTLLHKTDIGGVRLDLPDAAAVREAWAGIAGRLAETGQSAAMDGVVVQPMIRGAIELFVGAAEDPGFGPVVAFGLGGVMVELLGDVAFRVAPLSDNDAREMVRSVRGHKLIAGFRGRPPGDEAAVREVLLRLSRLVDEVPEIAELDMNPLFCLPPGQGCIVGDARVRVRTASGDPRPKQAAAGR